MEAIDDIKGTSLKENSFIPTPRPKTPPIRPASPKTLLKTPAPAVKTPPKINVTNFVNIINNGGALCVCSNGAKYPKIPFFIMLKLKEHSSSQSVYPEKYAFVLRKIPTKNAAASNACQTLKLLKHRPTLKKPMPASPSLIWQIIIFKL